MDKELIIKYFNNLKLPGFEIEINEDTYLNFVRRTKEQISTIRGINIMTNKCNGFSCAIIFPKYDELNRESINIGDKNFTPVSIRPYNQEEINGLIFEKKLNDNFPINFDSISNLEQTGELLIQYFAQANKFFNSWKDVRSFLPFIEEENSISLRLLGNPYILKKMTIWKLCSHPNYEEFVNKRIEILESAISENPDNEDYIQMLKEIKMKYDFLNDIYPDYKWNADYS